MIPTVTDMVIHVHAGGGVWAELTMFTHADGSPILTAGTGKTGSRLVVGAGGEIAKGTFPFQVAGMSVAG